MKLRHLFESPRVAVMAFGRMNPPTIGHAKLVDKLKSIDGDHYLFLSQTQKPKTDPLSFEDKLRYAKFFFPSINIGHADVRTPIQALQKINELGYTDLVYVAGSDRVASFEELLNKYNGQADKSGNIAYNFNSIKVVSAGERDPDADGAEGMSASKMRQAAADGDAELFSQGVPRPELADELFAAVRQGMGLKEPAMTDESIQEGELVVDRASLRTYLKQMIDDAIDQEEDIEKLSKVLKMLVGKEIKSRGQRFSITAEDIVYTLEACKNKRKKMREAEQSGPEKIDPLPVPQFPEMPQQEGDLGDGAIARQTKLGMTLSNADGTFLWDASGKPSQWRSPAMAGMSQSHNLKTGVITVRYNNGGLKVTKRFDKDGNSLDAGDVAYGMGDVNRSKNADGSTKDVYSAGAYRLEVTKDANGQSKETYWKHNSRTDRVEVSANEVPADIMASLNQSRG
jgi:hypothetical protein